MKTKENAKLRKELKDTKDALEILKSHKHSGKMTQAIFIETVKVEEQAR